MHWSRRIANCQCSLEGKSLLPSPFSLRPAGALKNQAARLTPTALPASSLALNTLAKMSAPEAAKAAVKFTAYWRQAGLNYLDQLQLSTTVLR
jgi:hypothetical protein